MRVMHLIKTGVGATWALRQIEILIKEGLQVHVVLSEDGPMLSNYEAAGAVVHLLPIDIARINPWNLPIALYRFASLVARVRPDLIHSHFVGTTLFMRMALRHRPDIPRLFQVPGPLHLEKFFPRRVELALSNKADYWIATCKLTGKIYQKFGVSENRLFLSYYGTTLDRLARPGHRDKTRASLELPKDSKVVGMVAFMYPPRRWLGQKSGLKGHEDLIDALKILRDQGRDVVGVFVGGAWANADWYANRVREYGAMKLGEKALFLGTRNDIAHLYEVMDIAVHPSHSENVGGAVESLLLGVPTVASSVGGFPDVVIDGETGFLAPPMDASALAISIGRMLDDPSRSLSMAKAGQELCQNLFDVNRTGIEIADIYRKVIQRHIG